MKICSIGKFIGPRSNIERIRVRKCLLHFVHFHTSFDQKQGSWPVYMCLYMSIISN